MPRLSIAFELRRLAERREKEIKEGSIDAAMTTNFAIFQVALKEAKGNKQVLSEIMGWSAKGSITDAELMKRIKGMKEIKEMLIKKKLGGEVNKLVIETRKAADVKEKRAAEKARVEAEKARKKKTVGTARR